MANVNEARVFSNEGHTVIFESMYEDEQWFWKVQEIKDDATEIQHLMTDEGGRLYMEQLREWGYLGYN